MLTFKLLLAVSALCLWGDKPAKPSACCTATATVCGGGQDGQVVVVADGKKLHQTLSCAGYVLFETPDDAQSQVWSAGPDLLLVTPDGKKISGKSHVVGVRFVPDGGNISLVYSDDDESIADRIRAPKGSDTWIGVRMGPIPAALAAHLGDSGLLV
ncbi:MAG: hypothetical protein IID33_16960, partial [Planctomycetes bacterium]|nr:hypothetical protein [Planctomycetota bacterium]